MEMIFDGPLYVYARPQCSLKAMANSFFFYVSNTTGRHGNKELSSRYILITIIFINEPNHFSPDFPRRRNNNR